MYKILNFTFSDTLDNYGQVLQYLAIQEYLKKFEGECWLLRYSPKPPKIPLRKQIYWGVRGSLAKVYHLFFHVDSSKSLKNESEADQQMSFFKQALEITKRDEQLHPRHFEEFRQRYFHIYEVSSLSNVPIDFDVYSVGSDQIWNGIWNINFMQYLSPTVKAKRISIAPSFGSWRIQNENDRIAIKDALALFDLVTVREKTGLDICKAAERPDAIQVLDPTLYLKANDYSHFEEEIPISKDYVLIYLLGNPSDICLEGVYQFARTRGLSVVYIESQGKEDDYEKTFASVGQWLSYVKNATYVFTNSFHGLAFSIIYHRQFLVSKLIAPFLGMNDRIISLLDTLQLQDRVNAGNLDLIDMPIDYQSVDSRIKSKNSEIDNKLYNLFRSL